ncbi:hypothetical protein OO012_18860 [Rhodobacteraceae bacterium KMM 6894]|nr:hypothetical protein [Rhodobacteraceae bacterium KMM 6894]
MMIIKLQFENLRFTDGSQQHSAVVILTTDDATLCLTGRAALGKTAPRADIKVALFADAMRQVRQMPEYRSGSKQIVLSHGIASQMPQSVWRAA